MRADGVAEQRRVVAAAQPVVAAVLLVGPARGQVSARAKLVVDDRLLAHRRSHDRVAAGAEGVEEPVEVLLFEPQFSGRAQEPQLCRADLPASSLATADEVDIVRSLSVKAPARAYAGASSVGGERNAAWRRSRKSATVAALASR